MFTLDPEAPNIVPTKYRQVALSDVDIPLDEATLVDHFLGKEAYMRTRFIVVRNGDETAFVEVDRPPSDELFSEISDVRLLAGPDECAYACHEATDVGIPSQLAMIAEQHPDRRCVVVEGMYSHVSFILNPQPLRINVLDIVPPEPSKLFNQAQRLLQVAEDLPPIILTLHAIDSRDVLAADAPDAGRVLLPCQVTGVDFGEVDVKFLDQRPERSDWTVLGCERTRQIHEWFYDSPADFVDICPRRFLADDPSSDVFTFTRCCLLEEGMETGDRTLLVPWGSTLDEVRRGIDKIVQAEGFNWTSA